MEEKKSKILHDVPMHERKKENACWIRGLLGRREALVARPMVLAAWRAWWFFWSNLGLNLGYHWAQKGLESSLRPGLKLDM